MPAAKKQTVTREGKKKRAGRVFLRILIFAVLLGAGLTAAEHAGYGAPLREAVQTILLPVERVCTAAGDKINELRAYVTEFDALKAENEELRARLAAMEDAVRSAERTQAENAFLTEFLELKENHAEYRFIRCEAVACDNSVRQKTYTLNAGTAEGAAEGYPVITGAGLAGLLTAAGGNRSTMLPVTEIAFAAGAYDERSGETGVCGGAFAQRRDGLLLFDLLPQNADIAVGDRIRTSGTDGSRFPRGLLLGEITEILTDPGTGARSAAVKPAADFSSLRDVMILTDFTVAPAEE